MKKYLLGHAKQYFSFAVIAMYSTLHKLCRRDTHIDILTSFSDAPFFIYLLIKGRR